MGTKDNEILTKNKADLISKTHNQEREIRTLGNQLSALKADKDQLESALYDAQSQVVELEKKRTHLEQINNTLGIKNEALQAEIARQRKDLEGEISKLEKNLLDTEQSLLRVENEN